MRLFWHIFRWFCGGVILCAVCLLWTGCCRWTDLAMFSFLCIPLDIVNEQMPWTFPLWLQAVIGGTVLVISQLVIGLICNIWLGLNLWDYSNLPGSLWGQVCLLSASLHLLLAAPMLILFDLIGFRAGGPWPHYRFF